MELLYLSNALQYIYTALWFRKWALMDLFLDRSHQLLEQSLLVQHPWIQRRGVLQNLVKYNLFIGSPLTHFGKELHNIEELQDIDELALWDNSCKKGQTRKGRQDLGENSPKFGRSFFFLVKLLICTTESSLL